MAAHLPDLGWRLLPHRPCAEGEILPTEQELYRLAIRANRCSGLPIRTCWAEEPSGGCACWPPWGARASLQAPTGNCLCRFRELL